MAARPAAKVDGWKAKAVSDYIRALGGISKQRTAGTGGKMGRAGLDELIEEALKVPELRERLRGGEE